MGFGLRDRPNQKLYQHFGWNLTKLKIVLTFEYKNKPNKTLYLHLGTRTNQIKNVTYIWGQEPTK